MSFPPVTANALGAAFANVLTGCANDAIINNVKSGLGTVAETIPDSQPS
jgi:hypothetical protein